VFRGTATFTAEVDWLLLAQARIGYTHDRLLIFVQGGYAGADGTASANYTDFASDQTFSDSNWHNGWTIGGGFSYKATETLSFGAEYNYVDLNSDSYSFDSPLGAGPAGTADVDHQMHVAKFTINYHFGGN
ncbi:MAG: outer membrane beta-barrel protein, partial [Pseudomonadota bacterium]